MQHVLVTGGCGFIGSNLIPRLLERGRRVRVLDNLSMGDTALVEGLDLEILRGDIRDPEAAALACRGVDTVVHLAAFGSVVDSVRDPTANFSINAGGTLNMLQAAVAAGVGQFLFSSTGGALIGNATPPVNEQSLPRPISPYGAGKLACEAYLCAFAHSYGLCTKSLRFANVYGPNSAHKRGAVTAFIKAVWNGDPMRIYGDGSASRDFLHVDDLCCGILAALDADLPPATTLHLASGRETTVLELSRLIAAVAGRPDHPVEILPARAGEVQRNFATYDLAKKRLGFTPKLELEHGLQHTWDWFAARLSRP